MNVFGAVALHTTFVTAAGSLALALASLRRGGPGKPDPGLLALSRRLVYLTLAGGLVAAAVLLHLLVTHDFSNEYVVGHTDAGLPLLYLVTALWGGQEGSLLFWFNNLVGAGALAVFLQRGLRWRGEPWAIVTLMGISLFFLACLLFAVNPFDQFLVLGRMRDGDGLNPLLQNPAMVYHPPSILAGYAIWAVPFSYSVASLIVGDVDVSWLRRMRVFNVLGFFLLSLGNLFGAFWAYEELGWGGFWGWDPVENASLMPWFTATALLHAAVLQERRRMARVWNLVLIFITFMLTLLGTFITRTGFVQSVHAFGSGSMLGYMFLVFMGILVLGWLTLLLRRMGALRANRGRAELISSETSFLAFNWIMVGATAIVLVGTLLPTLRELVGLGKITITAEWFNKYMSPVGVLIVFLVGICPVLVWRSDRLGAFLKRLAPSLGLALVLTVVLDLLLLGGTFWHARDLSDVVTWLSLAAFFGAMLTIVTIAVEIGRAVRTRWAREQGGGLALVGNLLLRGRRRYGGYLNHLGVALLLVAFSGQAYKIEEAEVPLARGETHTIGDFELTMERLQQSTEGRRTTTEAVITVRRGGQVVDTLFPAQNLYAQATRQVTTEVDSHTTIAEDLYLVLVAVEEARGQAILKVVVNPLIVWLWIASILITLGTALALFPSRWLPERKARARGKTPATV